MAEPSNPQRQLLEEIRLLFEPIIRASRDPIAADELLRDAGWLPDSSTAGWTRALIDALGSIVAAIEAIEAVIGKPPQTLGELRQALSAVTSAVRTLQQLPASLGALSLPEPAALPRDLLDTLAQRYLERRLPALLAVLRALTLVRDVPHTDVMIEGVLIRAASVRPRLDLARLPRLLNNPTGELRAFYLPNGLATSVDAGAAAARLLPPIADLLVALGADAVIGRGASPQTEAPEVEAALARTMSVRWQSPVAESETDAVLAEVMLRIVADEEVRAGVLIAAAGQAGVRLPLGNEALWELLLDAAASSGALLLTASGAEAPPGAAGSKVALTVAVERRPAADGTAFRIGSVESTRLEVSRLRIAARGSFLDGADDIGVGIDLGPSALVIAAGEGDGFLQHVLPREGLRIEFQLALEWSRARGLRLQGAAGLETTIPTSIDIAGVVRIDRVHLGLHAGRDDVTSFAATTVTVRLGPVTAAVEQFGIEAALAFPPDGGNLGVADLTVGFRAPRGAALAIDAGVVVGGGYLVFEPERHQYSGAVHLEIARMLEVTAFGLLSTRMPDGKPGFSLLVLIAVEFGTPLQLGFGFTLNAIGGLVGINRTLEVETLRGGLRTGAMGRLLFPADPIRNAPQIVADLGAIFPPAPGRFLFGPMLRIGWGIPTLLTIDVGIVLELPAPARLIILGRMRVLLPAEKVPIVRLQLDVLGVVDFGSGDVGIDAVLYDSRVAAFVVTGEMALRANFGATPQFALAIGGFHPQFRPPAGFPEVARVAISLATGENPRLRLEAYLAVTTNTVQFGAHLDLYVKFGPFSVQGYLGFDTLIQFAPFGFTVGIRAGVVLKFESWTLLGIELEFTLSGPSPWRARGRAKITILFFSISASFDLRFGKSEPPPLPPPVDVLPELRHALDEPSALASPLARDLRPMVALRPPSATTTLLIHPLADLHVQQRVVPLDTEITRFGNAEVAGERVFTLRVLGRDKVPLAPDAEEVIVDMFAPAQFRDMSDDERLAAPAFEPLPAGRRVGKRTFVIGSRHTEPEMHYETRVIRRPPDAPLEGASEQALASMESRGGVSRARPIAPPAAPKRHITAAPHGFTERTAATGSAARAGAVLSGASRYVRDAPSYDVTLDAPQFVVVPAEHEAADTTRHQVASGSTYTEVRIATKPGGGAQPLSLRVVPLYNEEAD